MALNHLPHTSSPEGIIDTFEAITRLAAQLDTENARSPRAPGIIDIGGTTFREIVGYGEAALSPLLTQLQVLREGRDDRLWRVMAVANIAHGLNNPVHFSHMSDTVEELQGDVLAWAYAQQYLPEEPTIG